VKAVGFRILSDEAPQNWEPDAVTTRARRLHISERLVVAERDGD
jgi:hypothetical protein